VSRAGARSHVANDQRVSGVTGRNTREQSAGASSFASGMVLRFELRGVLANDEINELDGAAFTTRVFREVEWNWVKLAARRSLGGVIARDGERLAGFVNVIWDGLVHAWIQDTMVDPRDHRRGIGTQLVAKAVTAAREAGCEWLHVDFDDDLRTFYYDTCGFRPTNAGLIALQ